MYLKRIPTGDLIEVVRLSDVVDPFSATVRGISQAGEDTVNLIDFDKSELVFPSGEPLPLCWRDNRYRKHIAA
jgi:hypothetical protein